MRQPEGTKAYLFNEDYKEYKQGAFYWLKPKEGDALVEQDIAEEYDPFAEPTPELPDELPGKEDFEEAGIGIEEVMSLFEDGKLQSVDGIGPKTEEQLKEYFLNLNKDSDE